MNSGHTPSDARLGVAAEQAIGYSHNTAARAQANPVSEPAPPLDHILKGVCLLGEQLYEILDGLQASHARLFGYEYTEPSPDCSSPVEKISGVLETLRNKVEEVQQLANRVATVARANQKI